MRGATKQSSYHACTRSRVILLGSEARQGGRHGQNSGDRVGDDGDQDSVEYPLTMSERGVERNMQATGTRSQMIGCQSLCETRTWIKVMNQAESAQDD